MAAKREVVLIKEGCRVMWKDPFAKGSAMHILYAGKLTFSKGGEVPVCDLYNEYGSLMKEKCSVGDMWHIGSNHKRCKGKDNV